MEFMLVLYEDPELIATEEQRKEATQRALADYDRALELVSNQAERRYLVQARRQAEEAKQEKG